MLVSGARLCVQMPEKEHFRARRHVAARPFDTEEVDLQFFIPEFSNNHIIALNRLAPHFIVSVDGANSFAPEGDEVWIPISEYAFIC